jgi:hypothetical protein
VDATAVLETELADLVDEQLPDHIADLVRLRDRVDACLLEAVGEWDDKRIWASEGTANGRQWLAGHELSRQEAGSILRAARQLRRTDRVAEAVKSGRLSVSQGRILARLRNERTAEVFDRDEDILVSQAEPLSVDHTDRVARFWKANADSSGPEPDDDNERLYLSPLPNGWRVDGHLPAESGALVNSVLHQIMDEL